MDSADPTRLTIEEEAELATIRDLAKLDIEVEFV